MARSAAARTRDGGRPRSSTVRGGGACPGPPAATNGDRDRFVPDGSASVGGTPPPPFARVDGTEKTDGSLETRGRGPVHAPSHTDVSPFVFFFCRRKFFGNFLPPPIVRHSFFRLGRVVVNFFFFFTVLHRYSKTVTVYRRRGNPAEVSNRYGKFFVSVFFVTVFRFGFSSCSVPREPPSWISRPIPRTCSPGKFF